VTHLGYQIQHVWISYQDSLKVKAGTCIENYRDIDPVERPNQQLMIQYVRFVRL
jgi:hypothetical protein